VHGWLVDPDSQEYAALARTEDYDTSVNAIVDADHLMSGKLVTSEQENAPVTREESEASGSHRELSAEQEEKVAHGQSPVLLPERLLRPLLASLNVGAKRTRSTVPRLPSVRPVQAPASRHGDFDALHACHRSRVSSGDLGCVGESGRCGRPVVHL